MSNYWLKFISTVIFGSQSEGKFESKLWIVLRSKRYSRKFSVPDNENIQTNMNPWLHAEAMDESDDPSSIWRCTICGKSFRKSNFVHHVQIVHWDIQKKKGPEDRRIEKIKCELNCGRKVQRRNMKRHEKDVHMKKNTCKYCGRKFGSSKTLKIHYYYSHSVHMDAATENVDVLVLDWLMIDITFLVFSFLGDNVEYI